MQMAYSCEAVDTKPTVTSPVQPFTAERFDSMISTFLAGLRPVLDQVAAEPMDQHGFDQDSDSSSEGSSTLEGSSPETGEREGFPSKRQCSSPHPKDEPEDEPAPVPRAFQHGPAPFRDW